eukprot:2727701-Prymnesium_polylepis.2
MQRGQNVVCRARVHACTSLAMPHAVLPSCALLCGRAGAAVIAHCSLDSETADRRQVAPRRRRARPRGSGGVDSTLTHRPGQSAPLALQIITLHWLSTAAVSRV